MPTTLTSPTLGSFLPAPAPGFILPFLNFISPLSVPMHASIATTYSAFSSLSLSTYSNTFKACTGSSIVP